MENKKVKIKDVVKLINGHPFKPTDRENSGMNIIRIQNLNNPLAIYNKTAKNVDKKYIVKKGDILISWSASLGVYEWKKDDAYLNQHIFKVEFISDKISKDYFRYVIQLALEELSYKMHGVGLKHLTKGILEDYTFSLPSKESQEEIIYKLNIIESLIEKREITINLVNEYIKSIFFEFFGDPVTNSKKWKKKKLKDFGKIITGNTPPRGNSNFYSQNNIGIDWVKSNNILKREVYNTSSEEKLTEIGAENARIVDKNSILIISITGSKERIGDICLTKERLAFNQQINAFVPTRNNFYFYYLLNFSKFLIRDLSNNALKQLISKSALENLHIIDTDKEQQLKFEKLIYKTNELIRKLYDDLFLLKEHYQSLLYNSINQNKIKPDEIDEIMNDELEVEIIIQDIKASDFESLTLYNASKDLLFKILERTEVKNRLETETSKFNKGIIQIYSQNKINIKTNREHKLDNK